MSLSKENMAEQAKENVLLDWRWRFCALYKCLREWGRGRNRVQEWGCPHQSDEYGCIGCTKFQVG